MDSQLEEHSRVSVDSLALARKHVRALTDGGVSPQALLRALLEQEEANNKVAPLPSQAVHHQPPLKKSKSLSRTLSLSQAKTQSSHWSVSTAGRAHEENGRPPSSDQLSTTSTSNSGSRGSYLSAHTVATSLSSRDSNATHFPGPELNGSRPTSASTRAYWCTSCDTEFKRKFDWKRHEDEFHERYKKYPCPDCNRVFWGANTFNQHHKTRHNCKTCPHADKVIKYTRKKRAWACGFCAAFLPSMDRYIDHIGLHYESGRTKAHWYHSNVIYGLLHQPGVNAAWKDMIESRFSHIPKDQQPRYGWDPKTTGRKQGFLENETSGNLQDLLEFFNPTKDDPAKVAGLALDFAELTPANQGPGRGSLDVPSKAPPPPPPAPKREKSSSSSSSKGKPTGAQKELAPLPVEKPRPITQWPCIAPIAVPELASSSSETIHGSDTDVQMSDYDATAVPPPLFTSQLSPPPRLQYNLQQQPPPGIALSPSPEHAAFLTPATSLPQTPSTPFPSGLPRDTVIELLSEYMSQEQLHHTVDGANLQQQQQHHHHQHHHLDMDMDQQQPLCQHPPFTPYDDWNSICSTMVDDVTSPRGPPLPPIPHERQQQQQQQQQRVRRSDFWPPSNDGHESMYIDGVQACDLASLPPPPAPPPSQRLVAAGMRGQEVGRRSDVWAAQGGVDYEGLGYEDEIAPPPPSANWL